MSQYVLPEVRYEAATDGRLWWCNSHGRRATSLRIRSWADGRRDMEMECDPKRGGIMIPCRVVDLTDEAVVDYSA